MTAMIGDQRDPQATTVALTPLLDGFVPRTWVAAAFLLGAIARDSLGDPDAPSGESARARKLITQGEIRVLPYLVTNLSAPEIAEELYLSTNTVRTHVRHLYQKLGAHSRTQAIERARALGLLAPRVRA
jgi:DNA-binding NarL/FixJ family response regulator